MTYSFGAKNGPSIGKAAPGLPVPDRYDNSLNIQTNQLVASDRRFINSTFNDRSDWTKVTNNAAIGSSTVSTKQSVPSSLNMVMHPSGGGIFNGALKISDTSFVALTSEFNANNKTNLTLFDVSNSCIVKSQVPISIDPYTTSASGCAQIIPSSRPDLILVSHRMYADAVQRLQFFTVDVNSGAISNANTGTSAGSPLGITGSEWFLPWTIKPLGYISGKEVWAASNPQYSQTYFITLDGNGNQNYVNASLPISAGFLQRVTEDINNVYVAGMSHPSAGGSYATTNAYHFSPFRLYSINKATLATSLISYGGAISSGGVFSSTCAYWFGGMISYGHNGEGFFIDYNYTGYAPSQYEMGYAVSPNGYNYPFLCRCDLSARDKPSAAMAFNNSSPNSASQASFIAISPNAFSARSTGGFGGNQSEGIDGRGYLLIGWSESAGNTGTALLNLSSLGSGGANRSTQIVPFGDRLLVLDKNNNDTKNVEFVWVYPR